MHENSKLYLNFNLKDAVANVLIMLAILWVATTWFPQYVWVNSPSTMVLVAVLYGVLSTMMFALIITVGAIIWIYCEDGAKTGVSLVMIIFMAVIAIVLSGVVVLILLDRLLAGFVVTGGFWAKVALVIIKGIATPRITASTTGHRRED